MKIFFKKIVWFFLLTLFLSSIGVFTVYRVIDQGNYFKIDKKYKNVFLGHSHTECAFTDTIIKNTINLSNGGECYFYTYLKLKKILQNNDHLERVFISFSNNQIGIGNDTYDIWNDKYINKWFTKYGAYMEQKDLAVLAKNNPLCFLKAQSYTIKEYLTFLLKSDKDIITSQSWGRYNYLKKNKIDSILKTIKEEKYPTSFIYSNISIDYLLKMIRLCKDKGVNIYLVRSPVHEKWQDFKNEYFFRKILKEQFSTVNFLDFKNFPLDNSCFADEHHINFKGSTKFSIFFNSLLENGLLMKKSKQEFINMEMRKL